MRQAAILVGGQGARLGELSRHAPKPMAMLANGRPFLDHLLLNYARQGVSEVLLLAGHLGQLVKQRYDDVAFAGAHIKVVVEPAPAGTAGALLGVADLLDDTFLLANGDAYLEADIRLLERAARRDDEGVLALVSAADARRYGSVDIAHGRVLAFREKTHAVSVAATVSAGIYHLKRSVLNRIAQAPSSIETDVFPQMAAAGVLGFVKYDGYFVDIGLPETLAEARQRVPALLGEFPQLGG